MHRRYQLGLQEYLAAIASTEFTLTDVEKIALKKIFYEVTSVASAPKLPTVDHKERRIQWRHQQQRHRYRGK